MSKIKLILIALLLSLFIGASAQTTVDYDSSNVVGIDTLRVSKIEITGTHAAATPDAACIIKRTINEPSGAGHGFDDCTNFSNSDGSYAMYNGSARTYSGTGENFGHIIGFQCRGGHASNGTLNQMLGFGDYNVQSGGNTGVIQSFISAPVLETGTTSDERAGVVIYNTGGSGTVNYNTGIIIKALTGNTYAESFVTEGTTPSLFGGYVGFNTNRTYRDAPVHITGETTDDTKYSLKIDNSDHNKILYIRNDARAELMGKLGVNITPTEKLTVAGRIRSTNSDIVVEDSTRGIILKSNSGHYWRQTISDTGCPSYVDLGTTLPTE